MIVEAEPLTMEPQGALGLGIRPGATGERGDTLANGQVETFDKGGLNAGVETDTA